MKCPYRNLLEAEEESCIIHYLTINCRSMYLIVNDNSRDLYTWRHRDCDITLLVGSFNSQWRSELVRVCIQNHPDCSANSGTALYIGAIWQCNIVFSRILTSVRGMQVPWPVSGECYAGALAMVKNMQKLACITPDHQQLIGMVCWQEVKEYWVIWFSGKERERGYWFFPGDRFTWEKKKQLTAGNPFLWFLVGMSHRKTVVLKTKSGIQPRLYNVIYLPSFLCLWVYVINTALEMKRDVRYKLVFSHNTYVVLGAVQTTKQSAYI